MGAAVGIAQVRFSRSGSAASPGFGRREDCLARLPLSWLRGRLLGRRRTSIPAFERGAIIVGGAIAGVTATRGRGAAQSRTTVVAVVDLVTVLQSRQPLLDVFKLGGVQLVIRLRSQHRVDFV